MNKAIETATLAGGCFWCTEAIFKNVRGVLSVMPGYSGGEVANPSYQEVSSGTTGHAECIQITFDPSIVKYEKLLEIFFKTHDPSSWDRQGADVGSEYRSIIFYQSEEQKSSALNMIKSLDKARVFGGKIVTEVKPFKSFYEATADHRDFYEKNSDAPYCQIVINPKLNKLFLEFKDYVRAPK